MPRLILVFAGCTDHFVGFVMRGFNLIPNFLKININGFLPSRDNEYVWFLYDFIYHFNTNVTLSVEHIRRVFGDNWRIILDSSPQKHMLWGGNFNEYPQHMFLWRNNKNYTWIILKYPPCLFHWLWTLSHNQPFQVFINCNNEKC